MAPKKGSTRPSGTIAKPQTAEDIRNIARGKAGLAEAKANAAKSAPKTKITPKTNVPTASVTPPAAKSVVSVDIYTDANGNRIETTTFSDGSKTSRNLGVDSGILAQRTNWIEELKAQYEAAGLGALGNRIVEFVLV